jgi:TRAP-type C4-dicarboxylate transport system permease small subunit
MEVAATGTTEPAQVESTGVQGPSALRPVRRSRWDRFESGPVLSIASLLFIASTGVMLSEGINRSMRDISFFWAEESVRFLMIWAFFLTLGAAGRHGLHIRTEMLVDAMGPRVRRLMHLGAVVAGLAFTATLFGASFPQLVRYYTMGMMSESNLDIPQWVVFCAMPLGAALWFGYYLRCLVSWIRGEDPFASAGVTGSEV